MPTKRKIRHLGWNSVKCFLTDFWRINKQNQKTQKNRKMWASVFGTQKINLVESEEDEYLVKITRTVSVNLT